MERDETAKIEEIKEPFALLHQIVKKHVIGAATFDAKTEA